MKPPYKLTGTYRRIDRLIKEEFTTTKKTILLNTDVGGLCQGNPSHNTLNVFSLVQYRVLIPHPPLMFPVTLYHIWDVLDTQTNIGYALWWGYFIVWVTLHTFTQYFGKTYKRSLGKLFVHCLPPCVERHGWVLVVGQSLHWIDGF